MNKPLWQPSEKLKENSLLKGFCKFINFKSSNNFKEIWQWSIDNPNDFWSKFFGGNCCATFGQQSQHLAEQSRNFANKC